MPIAYLTKRNLNPKTPSTISDVATQLINKTLGALCCTVTKGCLVSEDILRMQNVSTMERWVLGRHHIASLPSCGGGKGNELQGMRILKYARLCKKIHINHINSSCRT